jgi:hypothetical protein
MSTSRSSSDSAINSSAKTCFSGADGCESPDLQWKKTNCPSASSSNEASSTLAFSTSSSGSGASSSASGAPLPDPAAQQVQQQRPSDITQPISNDTIRLRRCMKQIYGENTDSSIDWLGNTVERSEQCQPNTREFHTDQ